MLLYILAATSARGWLSTCVHIYMGRDRQFFYTTVLCTDDECFIVLTACTAGSYVPT